MKTKKVFSMLFAVMIIVSLVPMSASASLVEEKAAMQQYQCALEEAKEYLQDFCITEINEFTTVYQFSTEHDLNEAAAYIAKYGLDQFNAAVDDAINEAVSKEPPSELNKPRTTTPTTVYKTISGNGTHNISAEAYGLASFPTLGTVEYLVEFGYRLTVSNGQITGMSNISFNIPYISTAGSWGGLSVPNYVFPSSAGATANYTITKTIEIPIGNFSFTIKSETDNEIFAILTTLV